MILKESQVSEILNQLQTSLQGRFNDISDQEIYSDFKKGEFIGYKCFIRLKSLSETQCKMFGLDPRGFQIAISIFDDGTGKVNSGEYFNKGPLVCTFEFDSAGNIEYRSAVSESRKTRGTGVYLNKIRESSDYDEWGKDPEVHNHGEKVGAAVRDVFYELDLFDYDADILIDYAHGCAIMYLPEELDDSDLKEELLAKLDKLDLNYSNSYERGPNYYQVW